MIAVEIASERVEVGLSMIRRGALPASPNALKSACPTSLERAQTQAKCITTDELVGAVEAKQHNHNS